MVQVPQSPPLTPLKIGYLRETLEHPRPASRLDVEPKDAGIAGAKMAIEENNAGGRFTGHDYSLDVSTVSSAEKAVEGLQKFLDSGHNYIVVDASADTLLKLSDWAKGKDILLFNIRATDVSLRQENCRANVMHVVPDRYMLADALAQYLVTMKWTNWLSCTARPRATLPMPRRSSARPAASAQPSSTRASTRTTQAAGATMSAPFRRASRRASGRRSPRSPTIR